MAKKLLQFRYYGEKEKDRYGEEMKDRNFPADISMENLADGSIFKKSPYNVMPISQLGIQSLPGTKFYLNGAVNPITLGVSGIYDLDIKNGARINDLKFNKQSLNRVNNELNGYLIVDVLYGEED